MERLSIRRFIPNVVTFISLTLGITSLKFAFEANWEMAVGFIVFASFLDNLDGKIARLLKSNSNFGVELDSLSDFISFGIAPVVTVYFWNISDNITNGWAIVVFYAICSSSRLAKFNLVSLEGEKTNMKFFQGISTPAAAGAILLPMMISFRFDTIFFNQPLISILIIIIVSILMISNIPTFSLKGLSLNKKMIPFFLFLFAGLISLLISDFWLGMILIISTYYLSVPFAIMKYKKNI